MVVALPEGERMGWAARWGMCGVMSASRARRPRSTSWRRAMVVRSLVPEARAKTVEGDMGVEGLREARPAAWRWERP